jgi:hypothetical protein
MQKQIDAHRRTPLLPHYYILTRNYLPASLRVIQQRVQFRTVYQQIYEPNYEPIHGQTPSGLD